MTGPAPLPDLDQLRRQIDLIDDDLHALLLKRARLALSIAQAKGPGAPLFRPAREAQILRRLVSRHEGPLPVRALVRIWREIMTALLCLQGNFAVALHLPAGMEQIADLVDDHFGATVPVTSYGSWAQVIRAVQDNGNAIGVLPWPEENEPQPWWPALVGSTMQRRPRIVARLPFLTQGQGISAAVIGSAPVDVTGKDRAVIALETAGDVSRTRLIGRLQSAGFDPKTIITEEAVARSAGEKLHLIEVDGHVALDDPRLIQVPASDDDPIHRMHALGGYAIPILLGPGQRG